MGWKDGFPKQEAVVHTDFIALYRGQTVVESRIIAVTADPEIVDRFRSELVGGASQTTVCGNAGEPLRLVHSGEEEGGIDNPESRR